MKLPRLPGTWTKAAPDPFWTKGNLLHLLILFLAVSVLSGLINRSWIFRQAHLATMDAMAVASPKSVSGLCRIVRMREVDYRGKCVDGASDRARRLFATVERIARLDPAVVAVDLDTTSGDFSSLQALRQGGPWTIGRTRVVWARTAHLREQDQAEAEPELELDDLLGEPRAELSDWGMALAAREGDWPLRSFTRQFGIVGHGDVPSFAVAIVQNLCVDPKRRLGKERLDCAQTLSEIRENPQQPKPMARYYQVPTLYLDELPKLDSPLPDTDSILRDKVVVLSGDWVGSDIHPTAFGVLRGPELVANAVEAEFEPEGHHWTAEVVDLGIESLLALALAMIQHFLRARPALVLSVGMVFLAFAVTVFLYSLFGHLTSFVPFTAAIVLDRLWVSTEQVRRSELASEGVS